MTKKSILRLLQASLMCCLAVLFTACDDVFGNEDNPMSAYLSMSDKPVTLKVGDTYRRKAISVSSAVVEYTSSKTDVATVDNEGLVTAKAEGTTTITATATGYSSQNGKKIYQPASVSNVVTVKPATLPAATITTDPKATASDILAGSATALVTAGVADGGTMMYLVTAANEAKPTSTDGFSADIPSASNRAAGTYSVWYYAKGDATHSDSEIAATAIAVTVTEAAWAANEYNKGSWDGTKVVFTKQAAASVTAMTNTTTTWLDEYYTVSGNVTITGNVTLQTNVHLILQDGATLTINGQIDAWGGAGYNLYIYGQKKGNGKLNVTNNSATAINSGSGHRIDIHGGEVTAAATGSTGYGLLTGYLAVYGGKLTATSNSSHGINFQNTIDVYDGEVVATSNATSGVRYGIMSGGFLGSQILTVYGGKVTATGTGINASPYYGSGFGCYVMSGTSGIKFYFSADGTTWGNGTGYDSATEVGTGDADAATKKHYAKVE